MTTHLAKGMDAGKGSNDYGDLFWKIGLPDGRQVSVHADALDVDDSGALHTTSHGRDKENPRQFPGLILAAGQWEYAYAASIMDGTAIAVDHIDDGGPQS